MTKLTHLDVFRVDWLGTTAACDLLRWARPIRPVKIETTFVEIIPAMFTSLRCVWFRDGVEANLTDVFVIASLRLFRCDLSARLIDVHCFSDSLRCPRGRATVP